MNLEKLKSVPRLLVEVELKPLQGTRFQPTGFPDIGAATYDAPDGMKMLLVESTQSMANRMEALCWDGERNELVQPLKGLPYVAVKGEDGKPLTNSILEAHRINSAYILDAKDSKTDKLFAEKFGKKGSKSENKPFRSQERQEFITLLFKHDSGALLHGVFMPLFAGGRCRIPRALSAFVEAANANEATSGGVKNDFINPAKGEEGGAEKGYGNIPYSRSEYTGQLTAFFSLDLVQIRRYGLGEDAENLLVALALYKMRKVINEGLRFRTACDLKAETPKVTAPNGFVLPTEAELAREIPRLIGNCKDLFAGSPSLTETFVFSKGKKSKGGKTNNEEGNAAGVEEKDEESGEPEDAGE